MQRTLLGGVRKWWIIAIAAIVVAVGTATAYAAMPDSGHAVGVGPIGVGYQVFGSNIEITAMQPDPLQQVVSLTLPPGSYSISAEFNFEKPTGDGILACAVVTGGQYSAPVGGWVAVGDGPGDSRANQFSGTGLDVLPNGGTARLMCRQWVGATGDNPVIEQVGLNAIRIATVNEQ
jgi:hypothetical protein